MAHIVMVILSIFAVLPFILLISASLTEEKAALNYGFNFIPKVFSLDAYRYIMRQRSMIFRAYAITIFTTAAGTAGGLILTSLLGYGLTKDIPGETGFEFLCSIYYAVSWRIGTYLSDIYKIPSYSQHYLGAYCSVSAGKCI